MTIPGGLNQIKTPIAPGTMSAGTLTTQVQVQSVATDVSPPVAVCLDNARRPIQVRMDVQRGKGSIPAAGEFWVIDKSLGTWTFCAYLGGDPTGKSFTSMESVDGLPDALATTQADLDEHHERLDTMWTQGTVTAIQGVTNADVTLTDGTSVPGAQVIGSYAPAVGDTVWTAGVDGAGNRAIVGVSASSTVNEKVTNLVATSATISNWRFWIDSLNHAAITNPGGGVGIVSTPDTLYVVFDADTTKHAALTASILNSDTVINGATAAIAGWALRPSSTNHPALLATADNVGIVANTGALYVSQAGDTTLRADLFANNITAAGATYTNGLNSSSLQIGAAGAPADRQIMTYDLTATHNISCPNGTIYYRGGQLPAATSERSLKEHIDELGDPFPYLHSLHPSRFKYLDVEFFDGDEHVGLYVDHMDEADPATVYPAPTVPDHMLDDDTIERWRANNGRMPNHIALIAYLVRACQYLDDRVRDLENSEGGDSDADDRARER